MNTRLFFALLVVLLVEALNLHAEPQTLLISSRIDQQTAVKSSRDTVLQKQQLVKTLLSNSTAVKRTKHNEDAMAKQWMEKSHLLFEEANDAINSDNIALADDMLNQALQLIESSSRQAAGKQPEGAELHVRYGELLKGVQSIMLSASREKQGGVSSKEETAFNASLAYIGNQVGRAQQLAHDDQYREAIEMLEDARKTGIAVLNKQLESTALVYDPKLKNASEEFDYELARYHSYEELLPIAYAELKSGGDNIKLSERYVQESRTMRDTARQQEAKGDHQPAIETLMDAIKLMQTALRVAGLPVPE